MFHPEIKGLNSVKQLREQGKIKEALQIVLELEQGDDLSLKKILSYKLVEANLLHDLGNILDAIDIAKEIFKEFQKLGDLVSAFDALLIQAHSYMIMVNITQSEDVIRQAEDLFQIIKVTSSIDLRERESEFVRIKAAIHHFKGEIEQSLELNKRAYELAKDTGNKALISSSLNNITVLFYQMNDYDKAIKYAKEAFKIKNNRYLAAVLANLIEINIIKGDIKEAKVNLDQLRELSEKFDIKGYKTLYHLNKASILKSSLRARDRIEAEDIFKEFAMDNTIGGEVRIDAIINLCDLYLTELRITKDPKIIDEIRPFIQELLNIAEKQHLYLYLAETHLLQAKLSLLTLDLKKAKRFLTQAQKVAETYGLKRLAANISNEHDDLLNQEKIWHKFKQSDIDLSERLEFAGFNEQMSDMIKKRIIEAPELTDEEPILLLIVSEGGIPFFTQSFIEEKAFKDHLLGGFFTAINSFISEIFSEGLDRASFGKYTLLMDKISPFLLCYVYKGQSYSAQKRIKSFIKELEKNKEIWDTFEKFFQANKKIQKKDFPSLERLIRKIFTNKIIPLEV